MCPALLLLFLQPLLVFSCDEGWTRFGTNCYKRFSRPEITNGASNDFCRSQGATLSSVNSDEERKFLVEFSTESYGIYDYEQMQIGGYRESLQSSWKWYDGSPFHQNHYFRDPGATNRAGEFYLALKADPYEHYGPFGYFIDQPSGPAHLFVCKKKDNGKNPAGCAERWTAFQGSCYRRLSNPSVVDCRDLNHICQSYYGAYLASVTSQAERQFIIEFSKSGRRDGKLDQRQPVLGAYRTSVNSPWQWFDGTPYNQYNMWHSGTPTRVSDRTCMRIKADKPSKMSYSGLGPSGYFFDIAPLYKSHVFICKKKGLVCDSSMVAQSGNCVCKPNLIDIVDSPEAGNYKRGQKCVSCDSSMIIQSGKCVCKADLIDIIDSNLPNAQNYKRGQKCVACDSSMTIRNGKCVCKPNLIDIVDSNLPDAKNYKRGQKCVNKGRCYSVKDSTSILFIFDSSQSITKKHWPKMVNFVKEGATRMPNTFRVGFMKFSTQISGKQWLKPNWSKNQYYDAVPNKYDHGETNTPLALREARKMLKNDDNKNRIAVLITDGMPYAMEYDTPELALNATKKAARALQKDGIRLTVMGVGRDVKAYDIREWLKNPRKDYLPFTDSVDCLKGNDMDNLLQIVCDCD